MNIGVEVWKGQVIKIVSQYHSTKYLRITKEKGFPGGSDGKVSACNAGDPGLIPGSGRSPGEGNGTPLQYSCLENPIDGWRSLAGCSPRGRKESDTTERLHFHFSPQRKTLSKWRKLEDSILNRWWRLKSSVEDRSALLLLLLSHFSRVQLCAAP